MCWPTLHPSTMPKDEPKEQPVKEEEIKVGEEQSETEEPLEREVDLEDIEGVHKPVSSAPTAVPKHFSEQEVHYESSGTYRLYKYIKDAWKKIYDSTWGNLTSSQVTDLTDGGASTLHKHDHGGQDGLSDDDHSQYHNDTRGDARYIKKDGTTSDISADIPLNTHKLTGVTDPTAAQDAATKNYVDNALGTRWVLESETTVASDCTSFDITGLDLATDKSYMIQAWLVEANVGQNIIKMYANDDTTDSNYAYQNIIADATSLQAGRGTDNILAVLPQATQCFLVGTMAKPYGGYPTFHYQYNSGNGTSITLRIHAWQRKNSENITKLTFTGDQTNGIAQYTKVLIFKIE